MEEINEKTWQKNAGSQIVLDSIFAALAAVWVTLAITDQIQTKLKFLEITCSLLSFFSFSISAEGTTTAYDEKDVLKYVYYLFWYNIGVVLIGAAIGVLILSRFENHFVHFVGSAVPLLSLQATRCLVRAVYCAAFLFLLLNWIRDALWLLFSCRSKFDQYLEELEDRRRPEPLRRLLMRIIFWHRIKR